MRRRRTGRRLGLFVLTVGLAAAAGMACGKKSSTGSGTPTPTITPIQLSNQLVLYRDVGLGAGRVPDPLAQICVGVAGWLVTLQWGTGPGVVTTTYAYSGSASIAPSHAWPSTAQVPSFAAPSAVTVEGIDTDPSSFFSTTGTTYNVRCRGVAQQSDGTIVVVATNGVSSTIEVDARMLGIGGFSHLFAPAAPSGPGPAIFPTAGYPAMARLPGTSTSPRYGWIGIAGGEAGASGPKTDTLSVFVPADLAIEPLSQLNLSQPLAGGSVAAYHEAAGGGRSVLVVAGGVNNTGGPQRDVNYFYFPDAGTPSLGPTGFTLAFPRAFAASEQYKGNLWLAGGCGEILGSGNPAEFTLEYLPLTGSGNGSQLPGERLPAGVCHAAHALVTSSSGGSTSMWISGGVTVPTNGSPFPHSTGTQMLLDVSTKALSFAANVGFLQGSYAYGVAIPRYQAGSESVLDLGGESIIPMSNPVPVQDEADNPLPYQSSNPQNVLIAPHLDPAVLQTTDPTGLPGWLVVGGSDPQNPSRQVEFITTSGTGSADFKVFPGMANTLESHGPGTVAAPFVGGMWFDDAWLIVGGPGVPELYLPPHDCLALAAGPYCELNAQASKLNLFNPP